MMHASMNNPAILGALSAREGVADALYRCVAAFDLNDSELLRTAWLDDQDVFFDMDGKTKTGIDGIIDSLFASIGSLDTQHMISNVRVHFLDGSKSAFVTAYGQATHHKPGEGLDPRSQALTSGSQYFVDVVQEPVAVYGRSRSGVCTLCGWTAMLPPLGWRGLEMRSRGYQDDDGSGMRGGQWEHEQREERTVGANRT